MIQKPQPPTPKHANNNHYIIHTVRHLFSQKWLSLLATLYILLYSIGALLCRTSRFFFNFCRWAVSFTVTLPPPPRKTRSKNFHCHHHHQHHYLRVCTEDCLVALKLKHVASSAHTRRSGYRGGDGWILDANAASSLGLRGMTFTLILVAAFHCQSQTMCVPRGIATANTSISLNSFFLG